MNIINHKIVNIVALTDIKEELDLNLMDLSFKNSEYDPESYHALIYRINEPKLSILVNKSGKIIFNGGKSLEDIINAREIFYRDLIDIGYNPQINDIETQNIVISGKTELINEFSEIIKLKAHFNVKCTYEWPSRIIIKNKSPKFTLMIYKTGKFLLFLNDLEKIEKVLDIIRSIKY